MLYPVEKMGGSRKSKFARGLNLTYRTTVGYKRCPIKDILAYDSLQI
jgi:hypothetical protein